MISQYILFILIISAIILFVLTNLSFNRVNKIILGGKRMNEQNQLQLFIREPWFSLIKDGRKKVEGRKGSFHRYNSWIGNKCLFINPKTEEKIEVIVTKVKHYNNLRDYFNDVGVAITAPHLNTVEEAIESHKLFGYTEEAVESSGGMNALYFDIVD